MSLIEPFTPEGINPAIDYSYICIDRVNKKVDAIGDITALTASVAALTTKMNNSYQIINIKDYGAIGDGVVNDTTSINNAITALSTITNGDPLLYIPRGRYKITSTLNFTNKNFLTILSDNAIIVSYFTGVAIDFTNCNYLNLNGNLKVYLDATIGTISTTKGILIKNSNKFNLSNVSIFGFFYFGIEIDNVIYSELHSILSNIYIQESQIGIRVKIAEYIQLANCTVVHCSVYGALMQGGNFSITGGNYSYNSRVGIYVNKLESTNSDHASITGCIINHNYYCGILLQGVILGMNICNCQIWPVNGYDDGRTYNFSEVRSTYGKASANCIYLEDVVSVAISNCCLAYADNCICCDGWSDCVISNNTFKVVNDISNFWIVEVGELTTLTGNINRNNIMVNNVCYGVNKIPTFDFFMIHDTFTANANSDTNYVIKNNIGIPKSHILNINSVGTYLIGSQDYTLINANVVGLPSMPNNDIAGVNSQATSITIQPFVKGQQIDIQFYNTGITNNWVWIRFKTDNTTKVLITQGNGIMQHLPANKAICINGNICNKISFIPYGTGDNEWVVCGSNA